VGQRGSSSKIQSLIEAGIREGGRLVGGGIGRPEFEPRYYGRADPCSAMSTTIGPRPAEEVFGPGPGDLPYENEAESVEIAKTRPMAWRLRRVQGSRQCPRWRRQMRAGQVNTN